MPGLVSVKFAEQDRVVEVDDENYPSYTVRWIAIVDDPDMHGMTVLQAARLAASPANDPVPGFNASFNIMGHVDSDIKAQEYTCALKDVTDPLVWEIEVKYKRLSQDGGGGGGSPSQDSEDPLTWDPEYWIEWEQIDVPIERARCLTDLPTVLRGIGYEPVTDNGFGVNVPFLGPVVNACGQQTIDPLIETIYRPVLVALQNRPSALDSIALNRDYGFSINCDANPPKTFLGDGAGKWRFLYSQADRRQEKKLANGNKVFYYPTMTKLVYHFDGWDKFIVNNGQTCFRAQHWKYTTDPLNPTQIIPPHIVKDPRSNPPPAEPKAPLLFPCSQWQLKEDTTFKIGSKADPAKDTELDPKIADIEEVAASEPMNLEYNGFQIVDWNAATPPAAKLIRYRIFREKDFNLIPPFLKLVQEYGP